MANDHIADDRKKVRLIDANEVLQRNEEAFKKAKAKPNEHFVGVVQYHTVKEMVNSSPTVDAVEVVRCKDCKRWDEIKHGYGWCCLDKTQHQFTKEEDFCSCGERRNNDG